MGTYLEKSLKQGRDSHKPHAEGIDNWPPITMATLLRDKNHCRDIVGLVPAAGQANRIAPLPCSKELFPIGFCWSKGNRGRCPKAVSHYLLEKMRAAGVTSAYIVLREGKWDIPNYFGDGSALGMHLAYLMMGVPYGPPYTLNQAYPFVEDALVVFGFPDILFEPDDAFVQLLARQAATKADLVLGLFRAHNHRDMDMVETASNGSVTSIQIKPSVTRLNNAWIIAVWTPVFTHFMHEYLRRVAPEQGREVSASTTEQPELAVGHVIQAAVHERVRVQSVVFPKHRYLDIGTPDNLVKAVYDTRFKDGSP